MQPRLTDWGLALLVGAGFGTGLWTLTIGRPELGWVFLLHGATGFALGALTLIKLWRVRRRIGRHPGKAALAGGLGAALLVFLVLITGVAWVHDVDIVFAGYNLLNWHIVAGFLLVALVSLHMIRRARPLRRADLSDRRQALRLGGLLLGTGLLVPLQHLLQRRLAWPGADRRFTGSREVASFTGNAFPTVSWIADRPLPLDVDRWQLQVTGLVERPLDLNYAEVAGADELVATLDCTGGFYSTQEWRGIRVGTLLDQAGIQAGARYVRFISVTGYRWSLPLRQARAALLATELGGEALSHGHGAPARLVAPGERGFVWVKWLVALEVIDQPDLGQLLAINTSSLSPAGRGEPVDLAASGEPTG
jgi:DMSO/TMAO reductase YedYZ molybdopterin-dependent catalytic subunit